jgi:hypothetical protein
VLEFDGAPIYGQRTYCNHVTRRLCFPLFHAMWEVSYDCYPDRCQVPSSLHPLLIAQTRQSPTRNIALWNFNCRVSIALSNVNSPTQMSKRSRTHIAIMLGVTMLAGCATTPAEFYNNRYALSNEKLCRTLQATAASKNAQFEWDVRGEIERRGLNSPSCDAIVRKQNAAIAGGLVLATVLVAAAASGGGGAGVSTTSDYSWEWDQFYGQYGALVWSCRGVQTGRFAEMHRCSGKAQSDWMWPGK